MRRMFVISLLAVGLTFGFIGEAKASGNCPDGSTFVGGKGHGAGGVCLDDLTGGLVKKIRGRNNG